MRKENKREGGGGRETDRETEKQKDDDKRDIERIY